MIKYTPLAKARLLVRMAQVDLEDYGKQIAKLYNCCEDQATRHRLLDIILLLLQADDSLRDAVNASQEGWK